MWGGILDKFPDACSHPSPQILRGSGQDTMARACGLGLLLVLLLPVVGASIPGTVVRLNKAVLSYGKRHDAGSSCVSLCMSVCT